MKLLLIFFAIFALNAWYLISIRSLMESLERRATGYWEKIGRPNSFSANHVGSMLSNLYKREMTQIAQGAAFEKLLKTVRILLPVTFVSTGLMLLALAHFLNRV